MRKTTGKKDDSGNGRKGAGKRNPESPRKTRITIRLDGEIIEWFRRQVEAKGGGNYQTLINDALRQHMDAKGEILEKKLRQVFREEIQRLTMLDGRMPRPSESHPDGSLGFRRKSPMRRPK